VLREARRGGFLSGANSREGLNCRNQSCGGTKIEGGPDVCVGRGGKNGEIPEQGLKRVGGVPDLKGRESWEVMGSADF